MKEEYLRLSQAAYLLGMSKPQFEKLVDAHKVECVVCQGKRLIRTSSLEGYVDGKRKRYQLAGKYMEAENKSSFWMLQNQKFHNQGLYHDDSMIEYLTVSQAAWLLGLSRQAVHGLLKRGKMKKRSVEVPGGKCLFFIRADEVERYVRKKEQKFGRALEFFQAEDSFGFWESHSGDFEEKWSRTEKERNQAYYERKKKKIQEWDCRAGQDGKTGTEKPEEAKAAVSC